eukprot:gene8962-9137_t
MASYPGTKTSGPTLLTLEDCNSYEANAGHQDEALVVSTGRKRSGLFFCCFGGSQADVDAAVHVPDHNGFIEKRLDYTNGSKGQNINGIVVVDPSTGSTVKQPADSPVKQAPKAVSHFSDSSTEHLDQATQLQEVDKMVKELGAFKACYVPDPPLLFGSPDMQFVPVPANLRLEAFWERIEERTSPFPQPIDVMLKLNFLVQKTHKSIPGLLIHETSNSLKITAIPNWLPPGINTGYEELFDKSNKGDSYWNLRRDMKLGSCVGRMFLTTDGTIVLRVGSRGLLTSEFDCITEDYLTLEEDGEVLVDRMCALHVASGKRATQYQVGRRCPLPYKSYK